jgi:hypothetical protein
MSGENLEIVRYSDLVTLAEFKYFKDTGLGAIGLASYQGGDSLVALFQEEIAILRVFENGETLAVERIASVEIVNGVDVFWSEHLSDVVLSTETGIMRIELDGNEYCHPSCPNNCIKGLSPAIPDHCKDCLESEYVAKSGRCESKANQQPFQGVYQDYENLTHVLGVTMEYAKDGEQEVVEEPVNPEDVMESNFNSNLIMMVTIVFFLLLIFSITFGLVRII